MASYKVIIDKRVRKKDLPLIPTKDRTRIIRHIINLANNPYSADSIQLKGSSIRRIRQGNYRILYTVDDSKVIVYVVKVGHRRNIYRNH